LKGHLGVEINISDHKESERHVQAQQAVTILHRSGDVTSSLTMMFKMTINISTLSGIGLSDTCNPKDTRLTLGANYTAI